MKNQHHFPRQYKTVFASWMKDLERRLSSYERIRIVFLLFFAYAIVIAFTAFKYSVLDFAYYTKLAQGQQTTVIKNSVNRGTIYSNNDPVGVLATSTDLFDLAVDPQQPGDKEKLISFLTDIIYFDICTASSTDSCQANLQSFLKVQEMEDYSDDPSSIKAKLQSEIRRKVGKRYVDSVMLKDNLNDDQKIKISGIGSEALIINEESLYFDFTKQTDKEVIKGPLSEILGMKPQAISDLLATKEIRYVKFLSKLNIGTKDKVDERINNELAAIKKGFLKEEDSIYKFLILEPHPSRFYPEKTLGSQIMGFVDNEGQGRYGVEGYFNEELKGQEGVKTTKKDISGRAIGLYEQSEQQLVDGHDITLTIDRNVQKELSRILEEGIKSFRANRGSFVVMDPKTGAIIAMGSYPDFDPNNYGDVYQLEKVSKSKYPNPGFDLLGVPLFIEDSQSGSEVMKYDGKIMKFRYADEKEIENRAISKYKFKNSFGPGVYTNDAVGSLYEPGSVFKAITTAIGIDTGEIKPSDMYMDKGFVEIDNFKISNVSKECIGYHPYSHALDWSCNVGMIDIVKKIGPSMFFKYINDFGFGNKTQITLEGEVYGKIQPYEKWSRAKLFTQSFGQGITATVLQMAAAYSVIANGGIYMQPYIVDTITLPNGRVMKSSPAPLRRVIKEETSKRLIAMLTEGATIGFAKKGGVEGYDMAGKTGTSQIASKGKYEEGGPGHTITSYGGFGPSSDPKFVMIVKIDRPRTAEFSETTSSALYAQMAKYLLNYYAIPKSR